MVFHLSEVLEHECAAVAEIDEAATRGWPLAIAMDNEARKNGQVRQQMIEGLLKKGFEEKNPTSVMLKVVVSETGELASAGQWTWTLEEEEAEGLKEEQVDAPAPLEGAVAEAKAQPMGLFAAMRAESEGVRREFGTQPHFKLQFLFSHPKWQRKGAGSMIIEYGTKKADEAGLVSLLTASEVGWRLYQKHGFEIIKYQELDLRPYGYDGFEPRRFMARKPQPKK